MARLSSMPTSMARLPDAFRRLVPGVALCLAITGAAYALEAAEHMLFGKAWLEGLVIAILAGAAVRTIWAPGPQWNPGIGFSAKLLLEIAVAMLGASVSATAIASAGFAMLAGIAAVVAGAILLSFGIGKLLRLPTRMALLVACGNSICGNSAIAAVAPTIGADSEDVAASIAFTAVLGVAVVIGLPVLRFCMGMSNLAFGAFAGLTVYAVPQVIAAAAPGGAIAVQMGTLVKLVRVLMLGPVCLVLALISPRLAPASESTLKRRPTLTQLVPWFIIAFLLLVGLRSINVIPAHLLAPIDHVANALTVVSMAALGLGVDVRSVARAGGRVTAAVVLSLVALGAISVALLRAIGLF